MSRKYIVVLALAAAVILIAGSLVRPRRAPKPADAVAAAPAPPPSRRGQMRQISEFLAERAEDSGRHVVFVPETGASGVVLGSGIVVTATRNKTAPFTVALERAPQTTSPAKYAPESSFSQTGAWVVLAGKSAQGQPVSGSGTLGGTAEVQCGDATVPKLLLNVPLDATYAGAGAFDASGELLGVVGLCGEAWTIVAHTGISQLLNLQSGAAAVVWRDVGLRLQSPDEQVIKALKLPATGGLFVTEVRKGSKAAAAGIRPGDLLLRSDGYDLTLPGDLLTLGETIALLRDGRKTELQADPAFAFEDSSRGLVLTSVKNGSRLYEAGLREGDRILRVGRYGDPAPAAASRLLGGKEPAYVVYERDDRRIGVLLP